MTADATSPPLEPQRSRGTIPDWWPDERDCQYAAAKGYDEAWINEQSALFRDHHTAVRSKFSDWHAAWRTWVGRAGDFSGRGRRPTMIKGLVPSLPERGKIKIGVKGEEIVSQRGNKFQPPQKLDHFIVTTLARGADGNFIPDRALMERFGDRPKEIPVRLLYDDPTLNFPTRYACFIGRTLWCAGDGEVATRLTETPQQQTADGQQPQPREVECPCFRQDPAYQGRDKCKMNGSLSVLIDGAGGLGGVWKFRTTSYNSIVGIMSSMALIRSITGGVLANIPFVLRIQPKQATSPTDGSQLMIYVVALEFSGDVSELQIVSHRIALDRAKTHVSIEHIEDEARRYLALAPPPNAPLPGDEPDDVVEEFYPEQAEEDWPSAPNGACAQEPEPQRQLDEGERQPDDSAAVENLTVPLPARAKPLELEYFARQLLAMIGEAPRTPHRLAGIRLANEHGLRALKAGLPDLYDTVMAALSTSGSR